MKYLLTLRKAQNASVGWDTPEQAVADFLLTNKEITPEKVINEMKRRIKKAQKKRRYGVKRAVICIETGVSFDSLSDAAAAFGASVYKSVYKGIPVKGVHWIYKESQK